MNLEKTIRQFEIVGEISKIIPFGSGMINSTYKVETIGDNHNYILQAINSNVFQNVPELMNNLERITEHIKQKLHRVYPDNEIIRRSVTLVKTKNGESFFKDNNGVYWRVFIFIEGSITFDKYSDSEQAYFAGAAYGDYQWMLSDLPEPELNEVLVDFHNTPIRIENLKKTIALNPKNRLEEVQEEVDFLMQFEEEMKSIIDDGRKGIIPQRIVHQDTKLSNILFDENGGFLCVIDLDTTMKGFLCYDFGDAVRGSMNTGLEDDENLENVSIDLNLFRGFVKGYAATSQSFITNEEINSLVFGAKLITYEQAVRFLDDYLNGDTYYKTIKSKHNLIRTKAQIALLNSIIKNYDEMTRIVIDAFGNNSVEISSLQ